MKQKVYFLSGLGLNERIFKRISIKNVEVIHIPWLEPLKNEAIESYANRMIQSCSIPQHYSPIFIGLSFGGLVAIEIAKLMPQARIIIISSIKHRKERPFYFSWMRWIPLYYAFSLTFYERTLPLWGWIFGIRGKASQKIFMQMFARMSRHYLSWAIHQVLTWNNEEIPQHIVHIHGRKDKVFPPAFIEDAQWIEKGDHGMIVQQAREISLKLDKVIQNMGLQT